MRTINFDKIEKLSENVIVDAYNELCDLENRFDDRLECIDIIDEIYDKPSELLSRWYHGYRYNPYNHEAREDNSPYDEYFFYNGYGNICTVRKCDVDKFCDFGIFDEENIFSVLSQYAEKDEFSDELLDE